NVVRGYAQVDAQIQLGADFLCQLFALELADGAVQHPGVHLEAHGVNVAALFSAKKVPGAAQLEIECGDLESRAQIGKFFESCQTPPRDGRELLLRGDQQIRISTPV